MMTVRVHMTPSELGEAGYHIDYPLATAWYENKKGDLILTDKDEEAVAKVRRDRWDSPELVEAPKDIRKKKKDTGK